MFALSPLSLTSFLSALREYGFDRSRVMNSIFPNNSILVSLDDDISTVDICAVLVLNFVELSKMGSLQLLRILQETPSEARGVGFEPFLHGLGVRHLTY
jgi:hypothetical protein